MLPWANRYIFFLEWSESKVYAVALPSQLAPAKYIPVLFLAVAAEKSSLELAPATSTILAPLAA